MDNTSIRDPKDVVDELNSITRSSNKAQTMEELDAHQTRLKEMHTYLDNMSAEYGKEFGQGYAASLIDAVNRTSGFVYICEIGITRKSQREDLRKLGYDV